MNDYSGGDSNYDDVYYYDHDNNEGKNNDVK